MKPHTTFTFCKSYISTNARSTLLNFCCESHVCATGLKHITQQINFVAVTFFNRFNNCCASSTNYPANMTVMGLYWLSNYRSTGPTLLNITGPVQLCTEAVNRAGTGILYWACTGMVVAQYWANTGMLYWPSSGTILGW